MPKFNCCLIKKRVEFATEVTCRRSIATVAVEAMTSDPGRLLMEFQEVDVLVAVA